MIGNIALIGVGVIIGTVFAPKIKPYLDKARAYAASLWASLKTNTDRM